MNSVVLNSSDSTPRQLFLTNLFWGAFTVYSVCSVLTGNSHVSEKLCQYLQLLSLVFVFGTSIFLIRLRIENNYLKIVFPVYGFWVLLTILRGIRLDFQSVMYMLLIPDYGILLYFVPLILLFPQDFNSYKKVFDVIIIFAIFFFISDVLYIGELLDRSSQNKNVIENLAWCLALPSGFILLTHKYHSNTRKVFALITMAVALLFSVYHARRGLSLILASTLIFSFWGYLFSTRQKILTIYLSALVITFGLLYATSIYNINNNKLLNFIAQRGEEDTRTGVELYFYNDMHAKDWIIGRGINGEYYCPNIDLDTDYRSLIETGYLQIILKGGLVRLILLLLILVPAVILGLFFSNNLLSKAAAIWILIALISLYPATVESFDLQYIIVWISVGICYNKKIRNYSNEYLNRVFRNDFRLTN
ncbi:MAG: hypothetical protein ACTHML_05105 [Ginsengibacter sp.]